MVDGIFAPVYTLLVLTEVMLVVNDTQPTVTLNEQLVVFPLPSFAVAVTVVVPTGKKLPDAWL